MSRVKRCKGDGSAVNQGVAHRAFMCIDCWFDLDWGGRKWKYQYWLDRRLYSGPIKAGQWKLEEISYHLNGGFHGDFPEQLVLREAVVGEIPCSDQGRWVSRWSIEDDGTVVLAWMKLNLRLNLCSNQSS
ncbi:hypothetical protein F0562_018194 [Nyssa sinensis]|uniref:Uncharacterized protein n=1 Tax=Nyssa sinensis TaxID=561372 RepID=A0A5J4ZAS2_9ASTE|nr:hypothetical protein F0562_018194 [Nyssa sinensis]